MNRLEKCKFKKELLVFSFICTLQSIKDRNAGNKFEGGDTMGGYIEIIKTQSHLFYSKIKRDRNREKLPKGKIDGDDRF